MPEKLLIVVSAGQWQHNSCFGFNFGDTQLSPKNMAGNEMAQNCPLLCEEWICMFLAALGGLLVEKFESVQNQWKIEVPHFMAVVNFVVIICGHKMKLRGPWHTHLNAHIMYYNVEYSNYTFIKTFFVHVEEKNSWDPHFLLKIDNTLFCTTQSNIM